MRKPKEPTFNWPKILCAMLEAKCDWDQIVIVDRYLNGDNTMIQKEDKELNKDIEAIKKAFKEIR